MAILRPGPYVDTFPDPWYPFADQEYFDSDPDIPDNPAEDGQIYPINAANSSSSTWNWRYLFSEYDGSNTEYSFENAEDVVEIDYNFATPTVRSFGLNFTYVAVQDFTINVTCEFTNVTNYGGLSSFLNYTDKDGYHSVSGFSGSDTLTFEMQFEANAVPQTIGRISAGFALSDGSVGGGTFNLSFDLQTS